MSENDAGIDASPDGGRIDATGSAGLPETPDEQGGLGDLADDPDAREKWMLRDDQFLLEEDREYVLRDEGRSWWGYVSPVIFGAVLAVMVGDVITTGVGMAMGLEEANPVAAAVIAEAGLGGLVLLKTMAAMVLLLLPGITSDARQTFRAGSAVYLLVGVAVVVGNAWAILAAA
ncbi:DUF5658 family protein [Halorussus gelatinilyticus]|uniref:DUF5658 family protein n=1 Tax=Halorussus gelatinilyticus TaxID=2937524 RepID=A0A8U0IEB5_9EURY|nr:DUF5658 family protein [Halorussus gelatinilyticus]UPV99247.1 DUF5658 family protein [Halorussus gelatinilyticus]